MTENTTDRPATGTWRARETRALRALLEESGVGPQAFIDGGPDGQDLQDLVVADLDVWNAFGLVAQDFARTDDDVHALLVARFEVEETDADEWTLYSRP